MNQLRDSRPRLLWTRTPYNSFSHGESTRLLLRLPCALCSALNMRRAALLRPTLNSLLTSSHEFVGGVTRERKAVLVCSCTVIARASGNPRVWTAFVACGICSQFRPLRGILASPSPTAVRGRLGAAGAND